MLITSIRQLLRLHHNRNSANLQVLNNRKSSNSNSNVARVVGDTTNHPGVGETGRSVGGAPRVFAFENACVFLLSDGNKTPAFQRRRKLMADLNDSKIYIFINSDSRMNWKTILFIYSFIY